MQHIEEKKQYKAVCLLMKTTTIVWIRFSENKGARSAFPFQFQNVLSGYLVRVTDLCVKAPTKMSNVGFSGWGCLWF
jgi:hypothetical protein